MAQLDYAASLMQDRLLEVHERGTFRALSAFSDLSEGVKPGQSVAMIEADAVTIHETDTNAHAPTTATMTALPLIVDRHGFINKYVRRLDDIVAANGSGAMKLAESYYGQLREFVAGKVIAYGRSKLVGPTDDLNRIANIGADALVDSDLTTLEALLRNTAGIIDGTPLVYVGGTGFEAACKGLINYQPPTSDVGAGRLSKVNGLDVFITSALETVAGQKSVATTDSTVASAIGTQTIAEEHGLIRGGLVTTTGLTANATSATPVTATTATSASCAITASDGANGTVGSMLTASGLGLLFVKPWAAFAIAGESFPVRIIPSPDGPGYLIQIACDYGVQVRTGGVAAIHVPAIGEAA